MGYLAAQGAILAIGIVMGLICSVIGLFFGHIILFDSIALGIVAGVCCNSFTPIHPALCLVIGIAVFLLLLWLQRTSVGFWVIGGLLTLIYAALAGLLACLLTEKDLVWGLVTFGIVFLVIGGLLCSFWIVCPASWRISASISGRASEIAVIVLRRSSW